MTKPKYPKYPLGMSTKEEADDSDLETRHIEAVKVSGSTAIHRVDYTEEGICVIYMNDGSKLEYGGVPRVVFNALQKAESKGRFFNAHIRNVYQHLN